MKYSQQLA